MRLEAYTSAAELWPALVEKAGLTGKRGRRSGAYDEDLIADLRERLFPGATATLQALLKKSDLTAEALLRAFFETLKPFAQMKIDILRMLVDAGADSSGDSLPIRFNFDPDEKPLDLLLSEFRCQIERFESVLIERLSVPLTMTELWELSAVGGPRSGPRPPYPSFVPANMASWLSEYLANGPLKLIPQLAPSGRQDADERLARVAAYANGLIAAIGEVASTREQLRRAGDRDSEELGDGRFTTRQLWLLESDYWFGTIARWLADRRHDTVSGNDGAIQVMIEAVDRLLPPSESSETISSKLRQLEDILDLPVWKARHEVYAVWIGAQVHRSLKDSGWTAQFHLQNGRLECAFRGVHLASLRHDVHMPVVEFWTELRTTHDDLPSGIRKEGIQPDYRLRARMGDEEPSDALVVEAKQHLRSGTREFAGALTDYAHACRHAVVLLTNYGPIGAEVLDQVDNALHSRCFALPSIRPDADTAVDQLRRLVSAGISAALRGRPDKAVPGAELRLTWGELPADLDLHIYWEQELQEHVYYGALRQSVAFLEADVQRGHGPEIAYLDRNEGWFTVVVEQYSAAGQLSGCGAKLAVTMGYGPGQQVHHFECPAAGAGLVWEVCRVDTTGARVEEIGRLKPAAI